MLPAVLAELRLLSSARLDSHILWTGDQWASRFAVIIADVWKTTPFIALLILVSLLFSAIVQERYREVGLLRAMGAQPNQVMTIILAEAAVITALGGLAGLGFGGGGVDTELASQLLVPTRREHALADVARERIGSDLPRDPSGGSRFQLRRLSRDLDEGAA